MNKLVAVDRKNVFFTKLWAMKSFIIHILGDFVYLEKYEGKQKVPMRDVAANVTEGGGFTLTHSMVDDMSPRYVYRVYQIPQEKEIAKYYTGIFTVFAPSKSHFARIYIIPPENEGETLFGCSIRCFHLSELHPSGIVITNEINNIVGLPKEIGPFRSCKRGCCVLYGQEGGVRFNRDYVDYFIVLLQGILQQKLGGKGTQVAMPVAKTIAHSIAIFIL